jgi:hypothetical protein
MRKIIAIGGEPATGKSTIMKKFIKSTEDRRPGATWFEREDVKLVPTLYMSGSNLHIIGKYPEGEPFGGTDRLSMAVQPQAVKFVKETTGNVLFEGDRLFNQSFLELLADDPTLDLKIIFITASPATIHARHEVRNDTQTDTFKRGRETKIENLMSNMVLMPLSETYVNETPEDQHKIIQYLIDELILG